MLSNIIMPCIEFANRNSPKAAKYRFQTKTHIMQTKESLMFMSTMWKNSCYVLKSSTTTAGLKTFARNCFSKMHKLMIISTRLITTSIRKIPSLIIT